MYYSVLIKEDVIFSELLKGIPVHKVKWKAFPTHFLILESTVSFALFLLGFVNFWGGGAGKRLFFRRAKVERASIPDKTPEKSYVEHGAIGNYFGNFAFLLFQTG